MRALHIFIILILSSTPLFSKDFKKTEDIITDILNERPVGEKIHDGRDTAGKKGGDERKKKAEDDRDGGEKKSLSMTSSDEVLFKMGTQLTESRLYPDAEKKFRELLDQFPQSKYRDGSNFWLGTIRISENRYDEAIAFFTEIKKTDSGEYPAAQFKLGECYQYKGDLIKSIEYFRRIFSLFPTNELADNALLRTGKLYLGLKKGDLALDAAVRSIKYYGDRETLDDAYYLLGKIYENDPKLKDPEMARKIYRLFLKKAGSGDPKFKNSPLRGRIESDLQLIEKKYFNMEN